MSTTPRNSRDHLETLPPSPLLVDLYELTMADAYRRHGLAEMPATFSLFIRSLPPQRRYLVAAGLADVLDWLEALRFGPAELDALRRTTTADDEFLDWLGELRFTGTVRAVPEGIIVFAGEPILEVDAPIAEGQLAETFLLNQITLQTTLATKAARCREAAAGRAVVDFAIRRAPGVDAAMKLVRVARIVGFDGTSNIAGADRYGLPASGTMAHSFVQTFRDERAAFETFAQIHGEQTVLLVDTYDTARGVHHAIEVARTMRARGVELRGIRLDSGDLAALARDARRRLDAAGFPEMIIVASGGLDEHVIARLLADGAPIDGFGVGTSLGVSSDAPTLESVYKLTQAGERPVRKTSPGKTTLPGPKQVWRAPGFTGDVLALDGEPAPSVEHRPLLEVVMRAGRRTPAGSVGLDTARARFESEWSQLPASLRDLAPLEDPAAIEPTILHSEGLRAMVASMERSDDEEEPLWTDR